MSNIIKDPAARLDYTWDWGLWLTAAGDTISAAIVLVPEGLTAVGSPTINGAFVTQRVSGGVVDTTFKMICQITTTGGLIDERSMYLTIMDR